MEGIKLAAICGETKRDYLSFDCAMKEKGQVRSVETKNIVVSFNVSPVSDSILVGTVW